jgi:hypothetical protein
MGWAYEYYNEFDINASSGTSSVNTTQHATIEEAVFSVSAVTHKAMGDGHVTRVACEACPFLCYIQ